MDNIGRPKLFSQYEIGVVEKEVKKNDLQTGINIGPPTPF